MKSISLITLSSRSDYERCCLLLESIEKFVSPALKHYVIVDKRDFALFSPLKTTHTSVLEVEAIMPWWILRLPYAKKWWFSFKTPPVRNWILQQLVKLNIANYINEDILIFLDTDVTFVRPFDPFQYCLNTTGEVRLLRVPEANPETHSRWHRTAGKLLGLEIQDYYGSSHIGNLICWIRENVLKLHHRIEEVSNRSWLATVASQWHLSEYILYGVFTTHILKENSGHFYDDTIYCHPYWLEEELNEKQVAEFLGGIKSHQQAIMLSSKAKIPPERYRYLLEKIDFKLEAP